MCFSFHFKTNVTCSLHVLAIVTINGIANVNSFWTISFIHKPCHIHKKTIILSWMKLFSLVMKTDWIQCPSKISYSFPDDFLEFHLFWTNHTMPTKPQSYLFIIWNKSKLLNSLHCRLITDDYSILQPRPICKNHAFFNSSVVSWWFTLLKKSSKSTYS